MPRASEEHPGTDSPLAGIAYEFRIGVTGHRELADPAAVGDAITALLQRLSAVLAAADEAPGGSPSSPRGLVALDAGLVNGLSIATRLVCPLVNGCFRVARLPERWHWPVIPSAPAPQGVPTTAIKLTGISCLAEGSDQLFIQRLDRFLSESPPAGVMGAALRNRYVEAVLPYPVDLYERDMETEEGLSTFRALLALDRGRTQHHTAPTVVRPGFPSDGAGGTLSRKSAFAAAGRYVVECSEVVVAIWDPEREELAGGTGETARYALECGRLVIWLNPSRVSEGWRILRHGPEGGDAARVSGQEQQGVRGGPARLAAFPLPERARELSANLHQFTGYNGDCAVGRDELDGAADARAARFSESAQGRLPAEVTAAIVRHIIPNTVRADLLSKRYRELRDAAARLWPTAAALAVTLMSFQILFLPAQYWLGWRELLLLLTCAAFYRVSLREAWHDKWRNNRRLAEALRSVLYASLVIDPDEILPASQRPGWRRTPGQGVENPLPFYDAGQSWFVGAVKRIVRRQRRTFVRHIDWNRDLKGIASLLANDWIRGQAAYHRDSAARHHHAARRLARWRLTSMTLIVLVAVVHALGIGHHDEPPHGSRFGGLDAWIAWASIALPAWAAAIHALSVSNDHERLSQRSGRLAPLLDAMADRMQNAGSHAELADHVREAESLMDLESQEWAESLSERKPEFSG